MDLAKLRDETVIPACAMLELAARKPMCTRDAVRMLLAVTLQEARGTHRRQIASNGLPLKGYVGAFGLWQIECATIRLIQRNPRVTPLPVFGPMLASSDANSLAQRMTVPSGDMLAAVLARLLLWADPKPLPQDEAAGWACYHDRVWKPGKPIRETWAGFWQQATEATEGLA